MKRIIQKKARKEKSVVIENSNATQSDKITLDSSVYLHYDILRIIFQYLHARDLASAAMVCRSWLEAANKEKWTRGPYFFFSTSTPNISSPIHLSSYVRNIKIHPSIGFVFFTNDYFKISYIEEKMKKMLELLPERCKLITLLCEDVSLKIPTRCKEIRSQNPFRILCTFLPRIPEVKIKVFELKEHNDIQKTANYQKIIKTINNYTKSKTKHEMSTCLLLFYDFVSQSIAERWISAIQRSKGNDIVSVWGGEVLKIYLKRKYVNDFNETWMNYKQEMFHLDFSCVAVLITGYIKTWSMILDQRCGTNYFNIKEQIEATFKLFKDKVKLKKHSIGFRLASFCEYCSSNPVGYFENCKNKSKLELTIFQNFFPSVPVISCYGYDGFGKTTFINKIDKERNNEEEHKCERSWFTSVSTVYLILTYG